MTDEASRNEADDDANGTEFIHDEDDDPVVDTDENSNPAADPDENASDRSDPLDDLAETVANGTDRSRSSTSDFDELFDRHDAADIDGDRLWKRLEADRTDESESVDRSLDAAESSETNGPSDSPESAEPGSEFRPVNREIREVEKRSYCQGCEHFADPPAVACTRDGTEILAVTSTETFRVADCPFVLEDEALEKRH
ncbi:hypothetical protein HYG81_02235 [Natrinema zhouii]|uniref:DUF8135 domain-containing protein n=1 Tax=Natrinema zhouii TaxID=1710539 RepID=A0A7D6CPG4_9EURY|nr:hypothetical protein [Natrinema zhouii]QLK26458.1 hypothetical protein HYG81_02235 [Natrinema zhouii]